MSDRISRLSALVIPLHADVTAAALAVGPVSPADPAYGFSTAAWVPAASARLRTSISIERESGAGPIVLVNVRAIGLVDGLWRELGVLNNGSDITVTVNLAWERSLGALGQFERLGLMVDTITGGNVNIKARPLETSST